jgi:hypothetical protein
MIVNKALNFAAIMVSIWAGSAAQAYPDMIRHNYVNCSACHVAPTGGGVLNAYGRSMSNEILSTWGSEREVEFLHGTLPENRIQDWFNIGGDIRGIQVHRESPDKISERFFVMQSSLELAASLKKFTGVMSIGYADPVNKTIRWTVSPRFYLQWSPLDELAIRSGRFTPVFGINVPYHTVPNRQSLGFSPGQERDTIETVWSGETWNLAASLSQTPHGPVTPSQRETLTTLQLNRTFADSYRAGLSYLKGATQDFNREAFSAHALCGISEKIAYITEFTVQKLNPANSQATTGLYHFSQMLYELSKGWNIYLMEDYEKSNLDDSRTLSNSLGPGIRMFPRPHFELDAVFLKRRVASVANRYDDFAWILMHYYF